MEGGTGLLKMNLGQFDFLPKSEQKCEILALIDVVETTGKGSWGAGGTRISAPRTGPAQKYSTSSSAVGHGFGSMFSTFRQTTHINSFLSLREDGSNVKLVEGYSDGQLVEFMG